MTKNDIFALIQELQAGIALIDQGEKTAEQVIYDVQSFQILSKDVFYPTLWCAEDIAGALENKGIDSSQYSQEQLFGILEELGEMLEDNAVQEGNSIIQHHVLELLPDDDQDQKYED